LNVGTDGYGVVVNATDFKQSMLASRRDGHRAGGHTKRESVALMYASIQSNCKVWNFSCNKGFYHH